MPVHMYLIIHCCYLQHFHALRLEHPRKCKVLVCCMPQYGRPTTAAAPFYLLTSHFSTLHTNYVRWQSIFLIGS